MRGNNFNPRTPCGVRHADTLFPGVGIGISIHAPRVGCDFQATALYDMIAEFQSTHPVWGATFLLGNNPGLVAISIHAPRVGCDTICPSSFNFADLISIHAPRVGCDPFFRPSRIMTSLFQSTHPVWGATRTRQSCTQGRAYFNPRTPCGVRPSPPPAPPRRSNFNPRTPCGVRPGGRPRRRERGNFNPRTPCGVRRPNHALFGRFWDFNPRTPCGVRHVGACHHPFHGPDFNPRTPCGVRHFGAYPHMRPCPHFNPRTPCGVRL